MTDSAPENGPEDDLAALREEVRSLRNEVAQLRSAISWGTSLPAAPADPAPGSKAAPAKPPPGPPAGNAAPRPAIRPLAAAPPRKPAIERARDLLGPALIPPDLTWEQFVGEKLLHYVGLLILALGVAFFLLWRAMNTTPLERVLTAALSGGALIWLGTWLASRPPYDKLSNGIIGGGWTVLFLTAYAAHHFDATRVIESQAAAGLLLAAVGAGIITQALRLDSKAFRIYAFGLTYAVVFMTRQHLFPFEALLVLYAASAIISVKTGHADILAVNVVGYALNFAPVWFQVLSLDGAGKAAFEFSTPFFWLTTGYLIPAILPLVPTARERLLPEGGRDEADAAVSGNAVWFLTAAYSMTAHLYDTMLPARALGLCLLVAVPAVLYLINLPGPSAAASVTPVAALGVLAAGIANMPSPLWRMFAWMGAGSFWMWVGLYCDHKAWRWSGLVMGVLTFGVYFDAANGPEHERRAAASALLLFAALSYFWSRFYRLVLRGTLDVREEPVMEFWLYIGTASTLMGLWALLDPAPFAVTVLALCIVAEAAAVRFERPHLWLQAAYLEAAVGFYSFFIDYGANAALAPGLTPRVLTTVCLAAGWVYLVFTDPTPAEFQRPKEFWRQDDQRRFLSWLTTAVIAFAVYHEVGARMRLPLWALGAVGLFSLGSALRDETFKKQALCLTMVAAFEAVSSYLLGAGLSPVTNSEAGFYWTSCFAVLYILFMARSEEQPSALDIQASQWSAVLAMAMIAAYLGKELQSYHRTLAWSVEGFAFLGAGVVLGLAELRQPALFLLGACVLKALLVDTSQMTLPYRVASFLVLGAALIAASMLYVKKDSDGKKTGSDPPR